jgi:integrase
LRSGDSFRSFATVKMYRGYIRKWVKPRWDSFHLDEIKAVDVEGWLLKCSATDRELGPGP